MSFTTVYYIAATTSTPSKNDKLRIYFNLLGLPHFFEGTYLEILRYGFSHGLPNNVEEVKFINNRIPVKDGYQYSCSFVC